MLVICYYEVVPLSYVAISTANPKEALEYELTVRNARIHPTSENIPVEESSDRYQFSTPIKSELKNSAYGLLPGGWLPPSLFTYRDSTFLLDRCTFKDLSALKRRHGERAASIDHLGFLAEQGTKLNLMPVLIEGNKQRRPSRDELLIAANAAASELRCVAPHAVMTPNEGQNAEASHKLLDDPAFALSPEIVFLKSVRAQIKHPVAFSRRPDAVASICLAADAAGISRYSFVALAAMSAALQDSRGNPARKLLKLSTLHTDEGIHNVLSDLRSLKMLAATSAIFPEEHPMFCTSDKNLALFWVALNPHGFKWDSSIGRMSYNVVLSDLLFPGIESTVMAVR